MPIDRHLGWRGDAEHGDLASVAHVGDHLAEGVGVAGHFEADVEAFAHAELFLRLLEGELAGVDGEGDVGGLVGEGAAVGVGVGDDDVAGSGMAGDGGGHDADGAGSGDEDVFAEDGEGERGVDGVAEGIEDGGDVSRDVGGVTPDVGHGKDDVFGEGPGAVDADSAGEGAEMAAAGEAVATASADDVAFAGDEVAGFEVVDVGADLGDFADEFVADDEGDGDGFLRPGVPVVDVEVGAADAGLEDADFDVVDAGFGFGDVLEPETFFGVRLDQGFHFVSAP